LQEERRRQTELKRKQEEDAVKQYRKKLRFSVSGSKLDSRSVLQIAWQRMSNIVECDVAGSMPLLLFSADRGA
jgi:hypothetical protein